MTSDTQEWLNPLNKIKFQEAVKAKKRQVTLKYHDREQTFNITYLLDGETIHFAPVLDATGQFTPCGYMNISRITHPTWLEA